MNADQIRSKIDVSWHELVDLVASLDQQALGSPNQDGWAIKDHMIHIGAWEHWLLALFQGRDKLEAMGAGGAGREIDDVNAVVWELHRGDSVDAAWRYFRDAHSQLNAELAHKTDADFGRAYSTFFSGDSDGDPGQTPVLEAVAANPYDHYAEHIGWIKEQAGKQAQS